MTLALQRADYATDRQKIIAVLQRNLPNLSHEQRFEWLYCNNPAGRAWSWLVYDRPHQDAIGVASVFPRTVWVEGRAVRCGQVGDFAIDSKYRSLGPALVLQRATFEPVQEGQLAFCYDCPPHDRGMAPFHRLGMNSYCRIARFAKLQRSRRELEKRFGKRLAGLFAPLFDYFLTKRRLRPLDGAELKTSLHLGGFGEEFTDLDARIRNMEAIRGQRGAQELNWRYREDPLNSYSVVTARRNDELMGYAVFTNRGQDTFVVDLLALDQERVGSALLNAISQMVKVESIQALYAFAAEGGQTAQFLNQAGGFRFRSYVANVVAYAAPGTIADRLLTQPGGWFFNYSDLMA